jgi:hypothetical protein
MDQVERGTARGHFSAFSLFSMYYMVALDLAQALLNTMQKHRATPDLTRNLDALMACITASSPNRKPFLCNFHIKGLFHETPPAKPPPQN